MHGQEAAKPHYKKAFQRDGEKYANIVIMDQLTIQDNFGSGGYDVYRYGIVICKVAEECWTFVPLRTLGSGEARMAFREFCQAANSSVSNTICIVTHTRR